MDFLCTRQPGRTVSSNVVAEYRSGCDLQLLNRFAHAPTESCFKFSRLSATAILVLRCRSNLNLVERVIFSGGDGQSESPMRLESLKHFK
jgi:hypothetical protein